MNHTTSVQAGVSSVFVNARMLAFPVEKPLPPLKPNQPNQSRPAPSSTYTALCGRSAWRP